MINDMVCHTLGRVKYYDWDEEKNFKLKFQRDVSFEEVQLAIEEGKLLDTKDHPNKVKYPHQKFCSSEESVCILCEKYA